MKTINVDSFVEIAEGIYWIGKTESDGLHANPYLIVEGDEAVVIDGGSRPDFSQVMLKIISAAVSPEMIKVLIYQHYDPDLCGSIPHFEELINRPDLLLLSQRHNNVFINHYGVNSKKNCINSLHNEWSFATGRKLKFLNTPYAHSPGSFITFDEKTGTLFSSDIFGSYDSAKNLYHEIRSGCIDCNNYHSCPQGLKCFVPGIEHFHKLIMTSDKALKYALDQISTLPVERILPQHGGIIEGKEMVSVLINKMYEFKGIGIDGELSGKIF